MCEAGWQSFSSCPGKEKIYIMVEINMAEINSQGKNMGECLRFPYPEGRDLITGRTGVAEINSQGKNMTSIGERLRFSYLEGRDLITGRTGVAEINSLGEKYDMYWGTP
jgi:hypothetical protein